MPSRSNAAPAYPALHDADATLRPESEAGRSRLNRKYTITCLAGVHIIETSIMAPAIPAFEDAFGALGRGTILQTRHGPVAVEDLMPGDSLRLIDGSFAPLLWRGMMTITQPARHCLTRITADRAALAGSCFRACSTALSCDQHCGEADRQNGGLYSGP